MHEFEGLLFSDPASLAQAMFQPGLEGSIREIRNAFSTPEDINDGAETAPSKRLQKLHGGYEKVISGTLAAEQMGIETIRRECPRFRTWVERLGALG